MNIQINSLTKTVSLVEAANLKEFLDWCQKHIEDLDKWKIEIGSNVFWSNPIIIEKHIYDHEPLPWWQQPVMYDTQTVPNTMPCGIFNLSING